MPIEDPYTLILVFLKGYDKNGKNVMSQQVQLKDDVPHKIELKGFRRLQSFTVEAWHGKSLGGPDDIMLYPWVIYVDALKYVFKT
jgi:hypothetical protein